MSVDINNLGAGGVRDRALTEPREDAGAVNKSAEEAAARGRPADVELSEDARSLTRAADAAGSGFDQARVDKIRAAIAEGRYHVDPERLAEKFLELETQLNQ